MPVLEVLTFPDERLRTVAKPVDAITPEIQTIIDDMIETMYEEEGIGLAATQVDVHQRIVVIDVSDSRDQPMVLINPEILEKSGEDGIEEGCLSVPDSRALVSRAAHVVVKALDRNGEEYRFEADELLAICVQHELDHLEGKLFVDYLSPLKRKRIKDKLEKIKRAEAKNK
jgi:peptide deformylase